MLSLFLSSTSIKNIVFFVQNNINVCPHFLYLDPSCDFSEKWFVLPKYSNQYQNFRSKTQKLKIAWFSKFMILQQITKIIQRVTRVLLILQMDTQTCCFGSSNLKTQKPVRFPNCRSLENKSVYNVIHQNLNWLKQLLTVSSLPLINFVSSRHTTSFQRL